MTKKARFIIFSLLGLMSIIGIFIFIMTWFYPYSFFSVQKSYDYEPYYISSNGAEYSELINEFKNSYENDLEADSINKDTNLTVDRTQYVLPLFEQEWLVSKEPLPFDELKLDTILLKVKQSKEI